MAIYYEKGGPNILPIYIILRSQPKVYEEYAPGVYASILGEWKLQNDTLFLYPKVGFMHREDYTLSFSKVTNDSTVMTIPKQFLFKKDRIIDVTDYNPIMMEPFKNQDTKDVYYRISK
jgi:hypothetical protein